MLVKLRYAAFFYFTSTGGAVTSNVFRANSVFDPDATGTGTQAYLSQWWLKASTLATSGGGYNKYRVLGSKFSLRCSIQPGAATASNVTVAVLPTTNPTAYGTTHQDDVMAGPYVKYRVLGGNTNGTAIKHYMSTAKVYGDTKQSIKDEDNYQAVYNGNPTNQWYWHLYMWSTDQQVTSNPLLCDVAIEYYCILSDRNESYQS